jgi:hypothetical protein
LNLGIFERFKILENVGFFCRMTSAVTWSHVSCDMELVMWIFIVVGIQWKVMMVGWKSMVVRSWFAVGGGKLDRLYGSHVSEVLSSNTISGIRGLNISFGNKLYLMRLMWEMNVFPWWYGGFGGLSDVNRHAL